MVTRTMQGDDPSALPPLPDRAASRLLESPEEGSQRQQLAQLAGALGVLARRVEAIDRPPVTIADRQAALTTALGFVAEVGLGRPPSVPELVSIARYLTGE